MIDSIEQNVESTHIRVHEGTDQLRQAEVYKNKSRKKKFILAIIAVIVLAIIIAIIAWQSN
jgi:t-SNARE complex subunit (syntaxin)